jgi:hypothetical protein
MTIYNDAELAAVAIVREALAERREAENEEARSRAMLDHLAAIAEQDELGPTAVVVALARRAANMTRAAADYQGIDPAQLLDRFEMHKIEQQQDGDEDEL